MLSKHNKRVGEVEFTVHTHLEPGEIRDAGIRAMAAGRRIMNNRISEVASGDGFLRYHISGPGGIVTQMAFRITWTDVGHSGRRVRLEVDEYLTSQVTTAFIPTGPKVVPALTSLKRFANSIRGELTAVPAGERGMVRAAPLDPDEDDGALSRRVRVRALLLHHP